MATTSSKPVKKLGQFLEEQQEPFVLEIYLLEKGCLKKNKKKLNSDKSLKKRSGSCSKSNTSKKGSIIPKCPKLLKVIYNKFVTINGSSLKIKNNDKRDGEFNVTEVAKNNQQVAESEQFSSASSTTVFNSCSESDAEEATTSHQPFRICNPEQKETDADRDQYWRHIEESKQISPVSVLEGIPSNNSRHDLGTSQEENNPSKSCKIVTKKSDDNILSASLWNLFFQSATEKPSSGAAELQDLVRYKPTSEFLKSKRVLQQTKQLLFDCVREAVETQQHGKEKSQQNRKENLESELLGKLICQKIKAWRRQSGGRLNITKLLDSDYQDSAREWNNFEPEIKDIAMEIGDAILEEIRDQIVTEMVYFNQL